MDSRRRALIVANDQYDHVDLQRLQSPAADAQALSGVLADPMIGGFDVQVVYNEAAHSVQAHVEEFFLDSQSRDILLLHFSCHGLKSESGELFLAARNTRPNRLGSTAISADFVQRCMRASRSRSVVLLLDCCYGGAFSQGVSVRASGNVNVMDSFPSGRLGGGRGRAVITASSAIEYAFEGDQLADAVGQRRPSVFTAALVEGLATGAADRDEDGLISLDELYDYVFDRVREQNPKQTPSRDIELEGDLYLARSRRRRIYPSPIPAELETARRDANMYTRAGAISELKRRLAGSDLSAAAGAHDALAETARTDIEYVAEPARVALGDVVIQPVQIAIDFGQIEHGAPNPHRVIELRGPPIARACTPHVDQSWIHAAETPIGIDVAVDTSNLGTWRGRIDLAGYASRATIGVAVEIVARQAPPVQQLRPPTVQPGPAIAAKPAPPARTGHHHIFITAAIALLLFASAMLISSLYTGERTCTVTQSPPTSVTVSGAEKPAPPPATTTQAVPTRSCTTASFSMPLLVMGLGSLAGSVIFGVFGARDRRRAARISN